MGFRTRMLDERMEKERKKKPRPDPDEETDEEMERPAPVFLNRQKSVFDRSPLNGADGINTAPSVFDKTAVFRTGK